MNSLLLAVYICMKSCGGWQRLIKEMIVVEGKEDTAAVQRAVAADTIETGGSAIGEDVLKRIVLAQQRRGVIILTDPDHPGERIRRIVAEHVPGCKHAFIPVAQAKRRGEVGVEHASAETIRKALSDLKTEMPQELGEIEWTDLLESGLIIHAQAAARREAMGRLLGIGHANGKTFLKRCRMFRITREEFTQALQQMEEEIRTNGC